MRGRLISALIVLLLLSWVAWTFFFKNYFTQQTGPDYGNVTDLKLDYSAEKEIADALERLKRNPELATIIKGKVTNQREIALTFDGLADRIIVQKIIDLLEKYNHKATFFVDGMQTAEDPQTVVNIRKSGNRIENYTMQGMTKMETMPVERLVKDFCQSQKIIKVTADKGANLLKCNETQYTDNVLKAARACGIKSVVKSDVMIANKNLYSDQAAAAFVSRLRSGSIVSVKLKPNMDPILPEEGQIDLKPAWDKQPGLKPLPKPEVAENEIVQVVERLLNALTQAKVKVVDVETYPATPQNGKSSFREAGLAAHGWHGWKHVREQADHIAGLVQDFLQSNLRIGLSRAYAAESTSNPTETTIGEQEVKMIYTTEPAIAFSFTGLSQESVVEDVLRRLKKMNSKATFFVTDAEVRQNSRLIRSIIAQGHEVGIAVRPRDTNSVEQTRRQLRVTFEQLRRNFGVETKLFKQPFAAITATTYQAAREEGVRIIGHTITAVQPKHKDYNSVEQIMNELFPKSLHSLARGKIVHFRLDYYSNPRIAGELMDIIKKEKIDNIAFATMYDNPIINPANDSRYNIKPVGTILNNKMYTYHYPADRNKMPENVRRIGPTEKNAKLRVVDLMSKYYIGSPYVNEEDRILGFSRMEIRRLDKSGLIQTNDPVIFLTFDDYGTDAAINKILYVLRKHDVYATFFIITRSVLNNPNLLRTIAAEGNEIGNHTDMHRPMVFVDPQTGKQKAFLTTKDEYLEELKNSYNKLLDITGDIVIDGKHMLTRYFRPPQLAINKHGMEAVFEAGFEYVVSGYYSTEDYAAEDAGMLVKGLLAGIYDKKGQLKKGSILVMHMSDTSPYTPIALDILLTANAAKADTDPTKFKVGKLSDYLNNGYMQKRVRSNE